MSLLMNRIQRLSKQVEGHPLLTRTMASACGKDAVSSCGKTDKSPSEANKPAKDKKSKDKPKFVSMWDPSCFAPPCPHPPPLDSIHYKPSDKATRKYTRTWNECPPRKIVKKLICEFPKFKMPPMEKRTKDQKPETAKCVAECNKKQNPKCIKISLPGCKKVRDTLKCKGERSFSDCKRPKCPYPAFSECARLPYNPKKNTECACLLVRSLCEVYNRMRQLGQM